MFSFDAAIDRRVEPQYNCLISYRAGGLALPDFPGLFKKSSFKMADSQSENSNESIVFRRNID